MRELLLPNHSALNMAWPSIASLRKSFLAIWRLYAAALLQTDMFIGPNILTLLFVALALTKSVSSSLLSYSMIKIIKLSIRYIAKCIIVICSKLFNLIFATMIGVDCLKLGWKARTLVMLIHKLLPTTYMRLPRVLALTKMFSSVTCVLLLHKHIARLPSAISRNSVFHFARL